MLILFFWTYRFQWEKHFFSYPNVFFSLDALHCYKKVYALSLLNSVALIFLE